MLLKVICFDQELNICSKLSILKSNATKSDPFTNVKVKEFRLNDLVKLFGNYLDTNVYNSSSIKADFINYLQYLHSNSTGTKQPNLLNDFKEQVEN